MTQPNDKSRSKRPRSPSLFWRVSATLLIPLLIVIIGTGFVILNFNPNRYAPALVAALEHMTGRKVTLAGPVKIDWSLTPAIQANDITIANPPGFADSNLLTLQGMRAEVALLPLLSNRVDILKLELISPDLVLERSAGGKADWDLSLADPRLTKPAIPLLNINIKVALEAVEVREGRLTIKTSSGATTGIIHFTRLTGTAASFSSPLHLTAQAKIGAAPFTVDGVVGPIERFSGIGSAPWPINLNIAMAGAELAVNGSVKRPRNASGYNLDISLAIPALDQLGQALSPALTGNHPLPPIQNIAARAHIADGHAPLPMLTNLTISAGKSDLSALRPGLVLDALSLSMPALDQPFSVTASGTSDSGNFSLQGKFGALQSLLGSAWQPSARMPGPASFPLSLTIQIGGANASVVGAIATPQTLSGTAIAITASVPDLSALSAISGEPLPAWKHISAQSTLIDPGGAGLYNAAELDGLTVTMDNAQFGGAATLYLRKQSKLQLSLDISQADLDALLAASPGQMATVAMPPTASPAPATIAMAGSTPSVIPDTTLPLGFLTWGDADIQITADNLVWHGSNYMGIQANASLSKRKLSLNPLTAEVPGGSITVRGSLDGSGITTAESLSVKAPALSLAPLIKAFGLSGTAEGNLQLQLAASSAGDTLREIAANVSGQLGIAAANINIDANLLGDALAPIEKVAGLVPASDTVASMPASVRCFGMAVNATRGMAQLTAFGLDSSQLLLQANGSLDLGQERFALDFVPFDAPQVQLSGSFAQPALTASPQQTDTAQPAPTSKIPPSRPDICPATLAAARFGQAGPAALPSAATVTAPSAPGANAPKNLLNSLLPP